MTNKTQLGIGAAIIVLLAAYFGLDFNQPDHPSVQQPQVDDSNQQKRVTQDQQSAYPPTSNQHYSDDQKNLNHPQNSQNQHGLQVIRQAYEGKLSNVQVQSAGTVKAILRDDNQGSRHQKFILALDNGLTVLVAHNIDLAPRIDNLRKGDTVEFFGEYEYSNQGGVMHWTHRDPNHRHEDGWLKHQGRTYK